MLGLVIKRLAREEPDALRRVLDAPVESWACGWYGYSDGRMCFAGHAFEAHRHIKAGSVVPDRPNFADDWLDHVRRRLPEERYNLDGSTAEVHFDRACHRFGIPRVVRAIKIAALAALEAQAASTHEPATEPAEAVAG